MHPQGDVRGFVAKVSDFGLSELFTSEGPLMGELGGTVTHIAPEIVMYKEVSRACDVYSFGGYLECLFSATCWLGWWGVSGSAQQMMWAALPLPAVARCRGLGAFGAERLWLGGWVGSQSECV